MKKSSWFLAAFLTVTLGAGTAPAEDYPTKPITLMTAFDAGGGSDVSHRLIEKFARGVISKPIVITYRPGAGLTPFFTNGAEFGEIIGREQAKAREILKSYGLLK